MMPRLSFGLAAFALVSACGLPEFSEQAPDSEVEQSVEAVSFLSANTPPPEGAADTEGDGILRDADGRPFSYGLLEQTLPAFTAPMADGSEFDSTRLTRWTVIAIWGTWCHDSQADGPYTAALERAVAQDPDLDFVSIHLPPSAEDATPDEMFGDYGSLEAYFESAGYTLPTVLDRDGSLRELLQVRWTPSYLLVSPDRVVRGFRTDLSVAGDQPVKSFIQDIARVRGEVGKAQAPTIGTAGAMGIKDTVPFTLASIEAAFPGHTVVSLVDTDGATPVPVFHVRVPGSESPRFIVEPDWSRGYVGRVRTSDPAVTGPNNIQVGTTRYIDLRQDELKGCESNGAGDQLSITCRTSKTPPYFQLFFTKDPKGPPMLAEMSYFPPVPQP
ncbi:MAG: TlpA disulfide reductase family protein [Hyphomonas sp.]